MTLPLNIVSKPTADIAHHKIHEGNHFLVHKINLGLVALVPKYFLIIPPPVQPDGSVIETHVIFEVDCGDCGGTLEFFENPTITANGSSLTIINNNRRSSTTSLSKVFEDPTVTSDGTLLFQEIGGNLTTGVDLGEFERNDEEFILSPNFNYILKYIPLAIANITMEINWYDNRPSTPI
jgi:hypothetical protein